MSDNVPKDLCEQKMNANLRLPPTEVWTEIFSFLPRRTLVQRVQPVNLWFKAICDKNVKSIHIIGDINNLLRKLGKKKPVALRGLEALEGHDCALAGHFRMKLFRNYYNGRNEMAKMSLLRHSLDLFHRCQLRIILRPHVQFSADELADYCQAYLTTLEPAKPSYIEMGMDMLGHQLPEFLQSRFSQLLCHSTTLNCARVNLYGQMRVWDNRQAIFEWLYHQVDDVNNVDTEENGEEEVRCLNLYSRDRQNTQFVEWLLEQCVQDFQQSKVPEDQRCFVLTFKCHENVLDTFEYENPATGEVLLLEEGVQSEIASGQPSNYYRLLRCLAHRVADNGTEQLFAKLFKPNRFFEFNNLERAGDVANLDLF